jgi:short-subunit dehydrogenase
MMESIRTVLITGANRGLGFTLARELSQSQRNLKIILTARDQKNV